MKRSECADLLGFCAAFDRRTVGDADVLAWHTVLGDIEYEQARDAVAAHYSVNRSWIMPADIRQHVTKARAAALADFQYEPVDPDEPPHLYLARLRGQIAQTAAGQRPPALALPPGRSVNLDGIGRQIPAEHKPVRRPGPLGVNCPTCKAPLGKPCKTAFSGRRRDTAHQARRTAAGVA